jgi:hypothetical protein
MTKRLLFVFAAFVFALLSAHRATAQTELVVNGGFESGASPWVENGTLISNQPGYAHSGNHFLWLGGITNWSDSAYQTVSVPSGVSSATLSFYYNIITSDDPNTAYDFFEADIRDTNDSILTIVGQWSNVDADPNHGPPNYHLKTFNLLPFAGQTVRISFSSDNDSLYPTSFFVDDVSLSVVTPTGPADLAPQNVVVSPMTALAGGSVTVNYTVANLGASNAPASHTKVTIKDSANNVFSQQTFATSALAGGATTNESHSIGLVGAVAGNYNVFVTVDANSEVAQTNTVNDTSAAVPLTVQTAAGLVIIPTFDSTITNDPNSATIQATINAAIQQYEALFSDPITVNIKFAKITSGLGQSSTFIGNITYSSLLTALTSDAKTTNDAIALAHLPAGPANPVNGNTSVTVTLPNLRALGLSGSPPPNQPDSTISLNISIMNLTRSSTDPTKYDLQAVAEHEIDEALSLGSTLNGLNNGDPTPTTPVHVMDLFRYDQNGARSFNTALATQAYFSIDGVTDLARFNQTQGGDFQDWYSPGGQTPQVQDAIGTRGATPNLGVELIALDVSGYNLLSAIPQPKIIGEVKNGNSVTLTWTSQSGLSYQLQYKTNITQVGWLNLGSPIAANTATTSASDTISATQRYYRVAVQTASSSIIHELAEVPMTIGLVTNYFRPQP